MNRKVFISKLNKKFSLRLHMMLILFATAMAGAVASKIFLIIGIANPAIRYPLTVLFAYFIFFIAVKIWLKIIIGSAAAHASISASISDIPDNIPIPGGVSSSTEPFSGGGGNFSGAGASGSFDNTVPVSDTSSISSGAADTASSIDFDVDELGVVILLILLVVLLAAVLGAGVYLIYNAPAILSEVAFDSFLAISLTRKTKAMKDDNWIGSIFKGTWKQFTAIFAFTTLTGITMHVFFPGITKLSELFKIIIDSGILN